LLHYSLANSIIIVPMFLLKIVTIIDDKLFSPVLPLQGTYVIFVHINVYQQLNHQDGYMTHCLSGSFLSSELNQRYQQNNNSWEIEKKMVNQLSKGSVNS